MPEIDQIGRQPAQEDPQAVHIGEIRGHDRPHVRRAKQRAPRHVGLLLHRRRLDRAGGVEAADALELGPVHQAMFFRQVAVTQRPPQRP